MPYATINIHRIHFLDTEALGHQHEVNHSKVPIVMIHGLGSSQNYYVPILPQLHGHRCIALTTYGAAESKSHGEDLTMDQLADDVIGLMGHLDISRAIVCGHSMGVPIALTVAARRPDRVAGIVGIGPISPSHVKPEIFKARIENVLNGGMESLANSIPQAATNAKSTSLQRAMIRELLIGQDPKAYASHCNVIINIKDPGLPSIEAPVLILAGNEDKSAPLEGCQYLIEHLGSEQKELKILNGVGHWHCIEASEQVGTEIATFAVGLV